MRLFASPRFVRGSMNGRFLILATLVPAILGSAQTATTELSVIAKPLGGETVKTVHYSGSGSSYIISSGTMPAGGWPHSVMKAYLRDLNLQLMTSKLQLVREEGTPPMARTLNNAADMMSVWSSQYQFWITPHGFLKGALLYNASVGSKVVFGNTYKTLSFIVPGNHQVVGYINDKDLLEKVETSIDDNGETLIEAQFHEYADFGGIKFPTMITEKKGGELSLILIVKEVRVTR
jgi:hypothetical protein